MLSTKHTKASVDWLGLLCTKFLAPVPHYETEVMELRGRVKVSLSVQPCGMLAHACIDTNDSRCCGLLGLELFRLKTDYMHKMHC